MNLDMINNIAKMLSKMFKIANITIFSAFINKDKPTFDEAELTWLNSFSNNFSAIHVELEEMISGSFNFYGVQEYSKNYTNENLSGWKTLSFVSWKNFNKTNGSKCPILIQNLIKIPGLVNAFLSKLEPGKVIKEHTGNYKGLLRVHLGLIIPQDDEKCFLTVCSEKQNWARGKYIIFDTTFPHSAENLTNEDRIVLILDVERHDMTLVGDLLNKIFVLMVSKVRWLRTKFFSC